MTISHNKIFKLIYSIHKYFGAVSALLILLISLSGVLLVFKNDYISATVPEAREVIQLDIKSLAKVTQKVDELFGASNIRFLVFAKPNFRLHKLYLSKNRMAYLNGKGELIKLWVGNGTLEDWIFNFHSRLLSGNVGKRLVGFLGLTSIILIITGLVYFWPMRRGLVRGLKMRSLDQQNLRSLHRNLGLYIAVPAFILFLSGAIISFPKTSRVIFDQFGTTQKRSTLKYEHGNVDWIKAFQKASAIFEGSRPRIVIWPAPRRPASIRLKQKEEWHPNGRSLVIFNPKNTEIIRIIDALKINQGRQIFNLVYPIHAAKIGSRIYEVMVILIGLGMIILSFAGFLMYIMRKLK